MGRDGGAFGNSLKFQTGRREVLKIMGGQRVLAVLRNIAQRSPFCKNMAFHWNNQKKMTEKLPKYGMSLPKANIENYVILQLSCNANKTQLRECSAAAIVQRIFSVVL